MPLGVAHKRSGIDGIGQLLVVECLSGDVDGAEPLEFLAWLALAHIDGEGIAEDELLLVLGQVEEVLELVGELSEYSKSLLVQCHKSKVWRI